MFAAKNKGLRNAGGCQDLDATKGKTLGAGRGIRHRQLQDQARTAGQGHTGTCPACRARLVHPSV
ncbi:MAG: hypothetical protein LRY35_01745 [Clostridiales bacterium]|nr:hypothetical protein [Clostridiales bacterium]